MISSYADRPLVVKCLVEAGCPLNARDGQGRNALFYSVAAGKVDTLAYLLDQGAEVVTDRHRCVLPDREDMTDDDITID